MEITLDTTKSAYENVSDYFAKAKKARGKKETVERVVADTQKKLDKLLSEKEAYMAKMEVEVAHADKLNSRKIEWFEKFRWFYASNGMLVVGGRDATTNEVIIKKHVDEHDLVFHTEMSGSPFFVLKTAGANVPPQVLEEVAQLTAVYSKAWKAGYASAPVFYVKPSQVSKHANTGEYIGKGSFMIRGEKTFLHPPVELRMGVDKNGRINVGTALSIRNVTKTNVKIVQGRQKPSQVAKELLKTFKTVDSDEIIRLLPSGSVRIARK